jgi:hypothetical protein
VRAAAERSGVLQVAAVHVRMREAATRGTTPHVYSATMKWAVFVALFGLGCGKSEHHAGTGSGSGSGSGGPVATAGSGSAMAQSEDPTEPPPPPIVKPGGKGDCKTDFAPKPTRDPNPMCKVDGGTFTMGDDNERMPAKLSPYYIDQFEVTAAQVAHFLNAHPELACNRGNTTLDPICFYVSGTNKPNPTNHDYIVEENGTYRAAPGYEAFPFTKATRSAAQHYSNGRARSFRRRRNGSSPRGMTRRRTRTIDTRGATSSTRHAHAVTTRYVKDRTSSARWPWGRTTAPTGTETDGRRGVCSTWRAMSRSTCSDASTTTTPARTARALTPQARPRARTSAVAISTVEATTRPPRSRR